MGLDTTHDCWHGPYSSFNDFRHAVASAAGIKLGTMAGYGGSLSWDLVRDDPIVALLDHSDCEGEIAAKDCAPLAVRLEQLLPAIRNIDRTSSPRTVDAYWSHAARAERFIAGLRLAVSRGESVEFH